MNYKCILFDLDHTLWDYETNSQEALTELYNVYHLSEKGIDDVKTFLQTFHRINNALWDLHDRGELSGDDLRSQRFHKIFLEHNIDDYELSLKFSDDYLDISPKKKNLIDGCNETLEYLLPKYEMVIVTNGFEEIQSTKLSSSGIGRYFKSIVTSARAGHKKPSKRIFEFALRENNVAPHEAIMVGDNLLTDIAGAANAKIDTVFFNPNGIVHQTKVNHEIKNLRELKNIL